MRRLLALAVCCAASFGAAQQVVYDNTATSLNNNMPLLPPWLNDSGEAGDDIWLGGTAREVTELVLIFHYRGTVSGTIDLQIRFREVDELTQEPSTAFYDSGIMPGMPTLAGENVYTFAIPNVTVPGHFVWTVQAYNRQGSEGELGPSYYHPPTVGFSDDFFWLSENGSPWTPYSWGGDPFANFAARFAAVPEPASAIAFATASVLLWRRRACYRDRGPRP